MGNVFRFYSMLVLVSIVIGLILGRSASVAACSCGGGRWSDAEVVVVGTVTDWRVARELQVENGFQAPLDLTLSVESVYKGNAPETRHFIDSGSYSEAVGGLASWHGTSGACGSFNFDPRGIRALYSLDRWAGRLQSSLCSGSSIPKPDDPQSDLQRVLLAAQQELGTPVAPSDESTYWPIVVGLVAAAGLAVLTTGTVIANRRKA